ncbi:MAG: FAD-dependent oxidoreductase, partial [Phycisphaeraceae bacterium]
RDDRIGGLLMYGVPNMKLDKTIVQRRVKLLEEEGVTFRTNADVGVNVDADELKREYDAILLACGALRARELDIPGRDLAGVHLAMDYLTGTTKSLLNSNLADGKFIDTRDRDVVVIGAGDTGTDCIGTALRQGCRSLLNITRREREPDQRDDEHPWPGPTGTFYVDYGHAEAAALFDRDPREYCILPKAFVDDGQGNVQGVRVSILGWKRGDDGRLRAEEVPGSERDLPAQLVFLAIGFTGHDTPSVVKALGVTETAGVVDAPYANYRTNVDNVFAAGDMRRGASLIVWAIAEGRGAARAIDEHLMGESTLPAPDMGGTQMLSSAG